MQIDTHNPHGRPKMEDQMGGRKPTKPSKKEAMVVPSHRGVKTPIVIEARRLGDRDVQFEGGRGKPVRLSYGAMINALCCWFMDQDPRERERIVRAGLPKYEAILADRPAAPAGAGHDRGPGRGSGPPGLGSRGLPTTRQRIRQPEGEDSLAPEVERPAVLDQE